MRNALALVFAIASLVLVSAEEPIPRLRAVSINGHDYVDLANWGVANGFKLVWPNKSEEGRLTNRWARLDFKLGGCRAEINGTAIWLSHPVVAREGNYYISRFDISTCLQPILFPPKPDKRYRLRSITLDPGHGGKDPGTQDGSHQEKQYTLLLASELQKRLTRAGLKVGLTRSIDAFVEKDDRAALARLQRADLFISLHYNSVSGVRDGIKGVEVHCLPAVGGASTGEPPMPGDRKAEPGNRYDEQNIYLAYQIQKALIHGLKTEDRGIRRSRYAVLRLASMPAILIECGFMSDPQEARRVYSDTYRRQLAKAIVDGVLAYKRWMER